MTHTQTNGDIEGEAGCMQGARWGPLIQEPVSGSKPKADTQHLSP